MCDSEKPPCIKPHKFSFWGYFRWDRVLRFRTICQYPEISPLVFITSAVCLSLPFVCWSRFFNTTIDVRTSTHGLPRWEMPSTPTWFDLRNPRNLKWMKSYDWKPAIHLDNRYRLMRGEPMLDENGQPTDEIGLDTSGWKITITGDKVQCENAMNPAEAAAA